MRRTDYTVLCLSSLRDTYLYQIKQSTTFVMTGVDECYYWFCIYAFTTERLFSLTVATKYPAVQKYGFQ